MDDYNDWHLPTVHELLTIVDYTAYDPALSTEVFAGRSGYYWSGSTVASYPGRAWGVHFSIGLAYWSYKTVNFYVRCVRGGPGTFGTLTLNKSGSGNGQVTSTPAGMKCCGQTCSTSFPSGTTVSLTVIEDGDSRFNGWSGEGCSGTGDCMVTVNKNIAITAAFRSSSATMPEAPTEAAATAGNTQATVSFTPPASDGGSPITSYTVTSNPGEITESGASNPITATGLTNGTTYTFTVTATNAVGTGPASSPSNSVTPNEPTPVVTSFAINNGAGSTTSAGVTLNNTVTGSTPTHTMASESPIFAGASWQTYHPAPSFALSSTHGKKTVYFKVRNGSGIESTAVSDDISLIKPALAAAFGLQGLWLYRDAAWSPLTGVSPNHMATYGNRLVANFPGFGLYLYDGTAWNQLASNSGVEDLVGASDKLYADFGSAGLWKYDGTWKQLSSANPDKMQANGNNLLATFPGWGLYQYEGTTWSQLSSNSNVKNMLGYLVRFTQIMEVWDFGNMTEHGHQFRGRTLIKSNPATAS